MAIIVYTSPPTTMVGLYSGYHIVYTTPSNDIVGSLTMAIIAFYLYKYGRPAVGTMIVIPEGILREYCTL